MFNRDEISTKTASHRLVLREDVKKELTVRGFLAVYVLTVMLFCAGTSPFIDFMGVDSSVFFTMGRAMAGGKTIYAELFDHKGWYLYFINCLGALIPASGSIGVFLVESLFFYCDAVLYYRIAKVFLSSRKSCLLVSLLMLLLSLNYFTQQGGNLTETYALTFQALSVLLVLRYAASGAVRHPPVLMFIHGLCVGIVFFLRANLIAMWGAVAVVILLRLLRRREFKNAICNVLAGLGGVLTACVPPVVYALATGSLSDMVEQSILFNLAYSGNESLSAKLLAAFVQSGCGLAALAACLLSGTVVVVSRRVPGWMKHMYGLACVFSILGVSASGLKPGHYYEYFIPLLLPPVIWLFSKERARLLSRKSALTAAVALLFLMTICCNLRTPIHLLGTVLKNKSWAETKNAHAIADIYRELELDDGTVLVTESAVVFYNKLDVLPKIKYFYIPAIAYSVFPDPVDAQMTSLLSGENDVVVLAFPDHQNYLDKTIYKDSSQNEAAFAFLLDKYVLQFDENDTQMWVKAELIHSA